jgi:hypothetical protein
MGTQRDTEGIKVFMFVRKASQNRPIDNLTVILTKTVHFWTMDIQAPVNTELNDRFLEPSIKPSGLADSGASSHGE